LQLLHAQTGKLEWLQAAADTYTSAFDLADYVATVYDNDEARLFLSQVRFTIHSKPVLLALQLFDLTGDKKFAAKAYEFDQRGKATALAYRQQELLAKKDLLSANREQRLKEEITRLSLAAGRSTDSQQMASLGQAIRDAEIALGKLHDQSGTVSQTVPDLRQLQRKLLDHYTAILSYNLSAGRLVCFSITANDFRVTQKTLPADFQDKTKKIIEGFQKFAVADERELQQWYRLLIPDSLQHITRWIVIPDGQLHYLPFEALKDDAGRYLVEKQSVQYQYTTALLQLERKNFASATTLGMAPFADNQLATRQLMLPRSATELSHIKGRHFFDSSATKQRFLRALPEYEILHLATHAQLDEATPQLSHIVFSPVADSSGPASLLFLDEIKNLPLQRTRLVILSACATAAGSLLQGEGVMSISRAFAYAGCPNVVTTLWKAEDAATAYLTQRLHRYLQDGKTLDRALQEAKKDYLNDRSINPRMKRPAYWAHLVFIGDYQREGTDPVIWWITGVSALIFVVLAAIQFRKRQPRR
jgi:CHAT domain-containing protein